MTQLEFEIKDSIFSDLKPEITEKFLIYHRDNPDIYEMFKKFAEQATVHRSRFGAHAIIERMRWETNLYSKTGMFKINNNYGPHYARLLISESPKFSNFFITRETNGTIPGGGD
jgi:hypothetical protein